VARITTVAAGITRSHAITNRPRGITSNRAITNRRRVTINRPHAITKAAAGTVMIEATGTAIVAAVGITIIAVVAITIATADGATMVDVATAGNKPQMISGALSAAFFVPAEKTCVSPSPRSF
jgi:hypothetical protein